MATAYVRMTSHPQWGQPFDPWNPHNTTVSTFPSTHGYADDANQPLPAHHSAFQQPQPHHQMSWFTNSTTASVTEMADVAAAPSAPSLPTPSGKRKLNHMSTAEGPLSADSSSAYPPSSDSYYSDRMQVHRSMTQHSDQPMQTADGWRVVGNGGGMSDPPYAIEEAHHSAYRGGQQRRFAKHGHFTSTSPQFAGKGGYGGPVDPYMGHSHDGGHGSFVSPSGAQAASGGDMAHHHPHYGAHRSSPGLRAKMRRVDIGTHNATVEHPVDLRYAGRPQPPPYQASALRHAPPFAHPQPRADPYAPPPHAPFRPSDTPPLLPTAANGHRPRSIAVCSSSRSRSLPRDRHMRAMPMGNHLYVGGQSLQSEGQPQRAVSSVSSSSSSSSGESSSGRSSSDPRKWQGPPGAGQVPPLGSHVPSCAPWERQESGAASAGYSSSPLMTYDNRNYMPPAPPHSRAVAPPPPLCGSGMEVNNSPRYHPGMTSGAGAQPGYQAVYVGGGVGAMPVGVQQPPQPQPPAVGVHHAPAVHVGAKGVGKGKAKHKDEDDDEIVHFEWTAGMIMGHRYRVESLLGDGTFGRVVAAIDLRTGQRVAIKVVRDVKRYTDAAKIEADILREVTSREAELGGGGPVDLSHCVRLVDTFYFCKRCNDVRAHTHSVSPYDMPGGDVCGGVGDEGQHICLVFEKLGSSLYDLLKRNTFKGFYLEDTQAVARQALEALDFLQSIQLTHTDLKPENVLFVDPHTVSTVPPSRISGVSLCDHFCRPARSDIKIIDFGGATFEHDHHCSVINTKQYRAPEVVLGVSWTYSSDLWCLGCILMEMYTGEMLFSTHDSLEHLAMMEAALHPIPQAMLDRVLINNDVATKELVNPRTRRLNWPSGAGGSSSLRAVQRTKPLESLVSPRHRAFADFVRLLLQIDPAMRAGPKQLLTHPFFRINFCGE